MKGKLFAFRILEQTDPKTATRFCRTMYGYKDRSNKGKYEYHRPGFLDTIPHLKLIRGVIIVQEKNAKTLAKFLKKHGAEIHIRKIELTASDKQKLKKN